jgi:hypothetical protein
VASIGQAAFQQLLQPSRGLPVRSAIIDGEAVALGEAGRSHFGDLQVALWRHRSGRWILSGAWGMVPDSVNRTLYVVHLSQRSLDF